MRTKKDLLSSVEDFKSAKFIDNNTLEIKYNNGTTSIRLHDTDIVTMKGKNFILNSGGWRTPTTKERINKFAPVRLYQNKGLWYLSEGQLFYDNCIVNSEGKLISKPIKINEKKIDLLKKQISNYCKLITKDNLPVPSSGDCWFCSMQTENKKSLGDATNNNDHLIEHLKEKYLHGSILVNAMREYGYNDNQIGFHYQIKVHDTFRRAVRRYLQKRLISNIAVK